MNTCTSFRMRYLGDVNNSTNQFIFSVALHLIHTKNGACLYANIKEEKERNFDEIMEDAVKRGYHSFQIREKHYCWFFIKSSWARWPCPCKLAFSTVWRQISPITRITSRMRRFYIRLAMHWRFTIFFNISKNWLDYPISITQTSLVSRLTSEWIIHDEIYIENTFACKINNKCL